MRFRHALCIAIDQLCTEDRDLLDLFLAFFEHLRALGHRGGVVKMYDNMLGALDRFKGLFDDVLSGLGQHLNRHIIGN